MEMATEGSASWSDELMEEKAYALSERELAKRPEVRIINMYALILAYMRMAIKLIGSLALLWSTVVLLGGFVTLLKRTDFWCLTFIGFVQAAGVFNALGNDQVLCILNWIQSIGSKLCSGSKEVSCGAQLRFWLKKALYMISFIAMSPLLALMSSGPLQCSVLALSRLQKQDYGSDDGDASKANLKPALNIFYSLSLAQGAIFMLWLFSELWGPFLLDTVSLMHGFRRKVIFGYFAETRRKSVEDTSSMKTWNLISYGTGLLDSDLPEDYVLGAWVLDMLIEQEPPIKQLLIRSSRHRIRKLISILGWRSPADREARRLASRLVAHIVGDIKLSQFPGALELIASLLDTAGQNNRHQEALSARKTHNQTKGRESLAIIYARKIIPIYQARKNGRMQDTKEINEDLILQGLRILENLAHDEHNCTEIYNNKDLLSMITVPLTSNKFLEDIETSAAWVNMVDGSLKVLSRLMAAPGGAHIGKRMRQDFSGNTNAGQNKEASSNIAVSNLEAVLDLKVTRSILELQTRAIQVLAQLFSDESINMSMDRKESFIKKVLPIFLTDKWIEDYLKEESPIVKEAASKMEKDDKVLSGAELPNNIEKRRKELEKKMMEDAMETASQLKVKAGQALAALSMGSQSVSVVITSYTRCDVMHCLTKMLDSKNKNIECSISDTEILKLQIKIECKISAAEILKHLCFHSKVEDESVKKTLLSKVLEELLNINRNEESQAGGRRSRNNSAGTDVENPPPLANDQQEPTTRRTLQQPEGRMLQAALLSLYAEIRRTWTDVGDFASVVVQLVAAKDFLGNLKALIEKNSYSTPACLVIVKITCQLVILLMQHNHYLNEIKEEKIIDTLSQASETVAGVETMLLFADREQDYYGIPVKPLSSTLVKQARDLLSAKELELANNTPAGAP